ncbi:MAG TPA: hypothetical protein VL172_12330 [Kofleriaceae bacterium]|nr:hypothetical protein [Kofleriaceae bacterium]
MSKGTAYRRITSAQLMGRFPVIEEYLADGRLTARTLSLLRDVLDEARLIEVLDRAAGRTEDQVRELVANLRPQPPQPDLFRRLPAPSSPRRGRVEQSHDVAAQPMLPLAAVAPPPARPATIEPIAPELHVMRVTVSSQFKADLEEVRSALSHKMPDAGLEELLHECLRVTLETIRKRRQGAGKKTEVKAPPPNSAYLPAPVRHAVWQRDGAGRGRCRSISRSTSAWSPACSSSGADFAQGGEQAVDLAGGVVMEEAEAEHAVGFEAQGGG